MKKVFGVMILAGLPVACGTTLPSTPEATQTASLQDAVKTVAATDAAESVRVVPVPEVTCAPVDSEGIVDGINIAVVERGKGWVRLGTKLVTNSNPSTDPRACFLINWSAGVDVDRQTLVPSADTQEATLTSTPGRRFTILATIQSRRGNVIGRTSVAVE